MKLGLLGAPGVGKSTIAKKFIRGRKDWVAVDGYIPKLQKRTGFTFGENSNFAQNLMVITERWMQEWEAHERGLNSITCGTLYETILYSSFQTMFIRPREDQMAEDTLVVRVMADMMGVLEHVYYDYDAILWIPYTAEQALEQDRTWAGVINAQIPELLEGFNKHIIKLAGSDKEKVQQIRHVVNQFEQFYAAIFPEPTVDEQSAVRVRLEDGESEELQPEPMPNLSAIPTGGSSGHMDLG